MAHQGRVAIVELGPELGMDIRHIEDAVKAVVSSDRSLTIINGQIIANYYVDGVVEEINEELQDIGQVSIQAMAMKFDLPAAFLLSAIESRMGKTIHGRLQGSELYTEAFVQRHMAQVRGLALATCRPTTVRSLVTSHHLLESLAISKFQELVTGGSLPGTLKGADSRSSYVPEIYSVAQQRSLDAAFSMNGYLELDTLQRMQIANPSSFLSKRYPSGVCLKSVYLSEHLFGEVLDAMETAATTKSFTEPGTSLPLSLSKSDSEVLMTKALATLAAQQQKQSAPADQKLMAMNQFAVSASWLDGCERAVEAAVTELAKSRHAQQQQQAAAKKDTSAPAASSSRGKAAAVSDEDDEEEEEEGQSKKKKKQKGEKVPVPAPAAASAKKGAKAGKKGGGKDDDDDDDDQQQQQDSSKVANRKKKGKGVRKGGKSDDEDEEIPKQKAAAKGETKSSAATTGGKGKSATEAKVPELTVDSVTSILRDKLKGQDCKPSLIAAVAERVFPTALKSYREVAKQLATQGTQDLRARHEALTGVLQELSDHIVLFHRGITELEAKARSISDTEVLIAELHRHLLKTLCTQAVDTLVRCQAMHHHIALPPPATEGSLVAPLSFQDRQLVVTHLPRPQSDAIKPLLGALSEQSSTSFVSMLPDTARACEMWLKNLDKKRDKALSFATRKQLEETLSKETSAPGILQCSTLVLHTKRTGSLLHAPPKCVPALVRLVASDLPEDQGRLLSTLAAQVATSLRKAPASSEEPSTSSPSASIEETAAAVKQMVLSSSSSSSSAATTTTTAGAAAAAAAEETS